MKNILNIILTWLKSNYGFIIIVGLLIAFLLMMLKINCDSTPTPGVIIKHDTTVITRYEEGQTDTIVKWYDRIIYVHPESDTIYVQKVDSVFIEQTRYKDVMLQVKKSKDHLTIFALNEKDSILKEYNFDGVYNSFTATSTFRNVLVSSSAFEWTGVNTSLSFQRKLESRLALNNIFKEVPDVTASLRSGIAYKNRLTVNALLQFTRYSLPITDNPSPFLGIELNYKLIK